MAQITQSPRSSFRDDYRQRIASGFKAADCQSWHGGSCRTQGWGDGRAADLWIADQNGYPAQDASPLFALVDQAGKMSQSTWGVQQLQMYRACMGQHGMQQGSGGAGTDRPVHSRAVFI
jgi:hypothetical protein